MTAPAPSIAGDFERWTPGRKAELVKAIQSGELSYETACERYDLSAEEISTWVKNAAHGPNGLRTTLAQRYRTTNFRGVQS